MIPAELTLQLNQLGKPRASGDDPSFGSIVDGVTK